jgi:hypothetical protein
MNRNRRPIFSLMAAVSIVTGSLLFAPVTQAANGAQLATTSPGQRADVSLSPRNIHGVFSVRLEDQLLATLRYLPVTFKPAAPKTSAPTTTTTTPPTTTTTTGPTATTTTTPSTTTTTAAPTTTTLKRPVRHPAATTLKVIRGQFVWRFSAIAKLKPQWRVGVANVVLHGSLMHFQSVHGLATTGEMDTLTWQALLTAAVKLQYNPASYDYVVVSQGSPQHLDLYVNGRHTYTSLVNTGISVAPTENGTYPVYLRYVTTTMSGLNPDGKPYHDTGIPWTSYFHGGDALHGFIRSSYGWPQSLGCVEMPFANAAKVWPHTPIGTLVTVK